ncbi:MAG: phosphoribosyltransferase [Dehalococcoidia bacterium]|nr:phosphoribosyltransferase [Dehalococcoidia bacterium]
MNKLVLTWGEFDAAVDLIARGVAAADFDSVYGVPRGGLPLAVALSHTTGRPLAVLPGQRTLVVDDVVQTGRQLSALGRISPSPCIRTWVWIAKGYHPNIFAVRQVPRDFWVVFPWEQVGRAEEDAAEYYKKGG